MSLLNLKTPGLAEKKPSQGSAAGLKPALSKVRNKHVALIVFCCITLTLVALSPVLINGHPTLKPPVDNLSQKLKTLSQEDSTLTSYIEPASSPASFRVALQFPTAEEELANEQLPKESLDTLDEIQSEALAYVNKVYTPLTLKEWHAGQLNKALKAIDEGFDEKAVEILEAILIKIPNAVDARENLAAIYLSSGDYARTAKIVNEGLKLSANDITLITIKARLLLDQGKAGQAIKLLSGYRPALDAYPDFYGTLAAALHSEGRVMEAGSIYRALIQVDPDNGQYWLGYGISLEHHHQSNQAIQAYNKAIQNPDSDPSVRRHAELRLKTLLG